MKKCLNKVLLIIICLFPLMVDAKADFTLEKEFLNEVFLYEEDGKNYFINVDSSGPTDSESLHIFDYENNLLESGSLILGADTIKEEYERRVFFEYWKYDLFINDGERFYKNGYNLYAVDYEGERINYFNLDDETEGEVYFDEDLDFTKNVLGKKYDIFDYYKKNNFIVYDIENIDNYYTVISRNDDYNFFIDVVDENLNIVLNFEYDDYFEYRPVIYVNDDLIYLKKDNKSIDIYKLDGTKIQTLTISHEAIDEYDNDGNCDYLDFSSMSIINNKLYLPYFPTNYSCLERFNITDANDFVKTIDARRNIFTLKYTLDFDVEKVESNNGEFTYETKEDEDGKSYVELKITPKEGYSVEEIIVTDVNGNRIEVTDNKFYKPMNDVKVEVKYVYGEYLPIPDTLLNVNMWAIVMGIVLIIFGTSTMIKIMSDNKIKE